MSDAVTLGVEIYRTDDYLRTDRIELADVLIPVFEAALGEPLRDAQFRLTFHAIRDAANLTGLPHVINLRRSHGYVTVQIVRDGRIIYQHPHAVREIIGRPLQQYLARQVPGEQHWGFGVSGPGLGAITLERPAPRATGSINISGEHVRARVLHVERVPEPDPPMVRLSDLGVRTAPGDQAAGDPPVRVVLTASVQELLVQRMELSDEVEEGGFLVGRLLSDQERGGQLVYVTRAPRAERTGASLLHFTFTGESFLRINQAVAESDHGERLVGWYHTHLFPATKGIGLSTIDVDLHTSTFLDNWHLAALINIDASGDRVLRAYTWNGSAMRQATCLIGDEWTP